MGVICDKLWRKLIPRYDTTVLSFFLFFFLHIQFLCNLLSRRKMQMISHSKCKERALLLQLLSSHRMKNPLPQPNEIHFFCRTWFQIIFPDCRDGNTPQSKKSHVTIKGCIDGVYLARQQLIVSITASRYEIDDRRTRWFLMLLSFSPVTGQLDGYTEFRLLGLALQGRNWSSQCQIRRPDFLAGSK